MIKGVVLFVVVVFIGIGSVSLYPLMIRIMLRKLGKLTQWGWPSGWALDLKVAVLDLIRSSLVQVRALTL